jgi:hypothetical protein
MRFLVEQSLLLAMPVLLLCGADAARAQALPNVASVARASLSVDPPAVHATRLEFQFADGSGAELRAGQWHSRTGVDLSSVTRWLDGVEVTPLITVVDWDQLDRWHQRACAVLPAHNRPGHLGLWYRARVADAAAADALLARLAAEPLVKHAYQEPILYPASMGRSVAAATCRRPRRRSSRCSSRTTRRRSAMACARPTQSSAGAARASRSS